MTTWNLQDTSCHLLICNGGNCMKHQAEEVTLAIRDEINQLEANRQIHTTRTRCNGRCDDACVVIAYPEGVWYKEMTPELGRELVRRHAAGSRLVEQMVYTFNQRFMPTGRSVKGQEKPSAKVNRSKRRVQMKSVPILILSGFLGSGKTTLLTRMLNDDLRKGIKPAVIMNEIGDVNLDGQLVGMGVPMSEMLSGCICCTIRGDLAMEIRRLIDEANPDHILIEASGVANPIEILDAVTEAAFFNPIEIRQ